MPHEFWGVKFPLFQEPSVKGKTLKTPASQTITAKGALYWPKEALPFAHGIALVQIVLERSTEAKTTYNEGR